MAILSSRFCTVRSALHFGTIIRHLNSCPAGVTITCGMARLIDDIRDVGFRPLREEILDPAEAGTMQKLVSQLDFENAVSISAHNVAESFFATQEWKWNWREFPNLAPPYPAFFIEYDSMFRMGDKPLAPFRSGVYFHATEEEGKSYRWMWTALLFVEYKRFSRDIAGPIQGVASAVNPDGSIPADPAALWFTKDVNIFITHMRALQPALLTISLMHCKNVRIVRNIPRGPDVRARRRRGDRPLVEYKTLEIEPMKKILVSEGNADTVGWKQAFHFCRGHFKDFRQNGLFGKHKDLYWWDTHYRGKGTIIDKDYNVTPPKPRD